MNGKKNRFYGKRCKLKDQNFTQFNFAQTHIDGTGQEKIIGAGMVRESKSDFIGTGSRTYPVPIGQTLKLAVPHYGLLRYRKGLRTSSCNFRINLQ